MEYYYVDGEIREDWSGGNQIGFYANGEVHKDWQGGQRLGFVDNEKILEEWSGGKQLGTVVNGGIYRDWSGGSYIGNARDYTIHGLEHNEPAMVACWHFLISKIFNLKGLYYETSI